MDYKLIHDGRISIIEDIDKYEVIMDCGEVEQIIFEKNYECQEQIPIIKAYSLFKKEDNNWILIEENKDIKQKCQDVGLYITHSNDKILTSGYINLKIK